MGPVAQLVSPGAALVVASAVVLCAVIALAVLLSRSAQRRRARLDAELVRSREEVDALSRRLEELSDEVVRARRSAEADREYVITSLGSGELTRAVVDGQPVHQPSPSRQPVTKALEEQLVQALAAQPRTSALRKRGVELVVRTVALGHGVRRALSADVLDRAAAEAHVARRRSRRDRRRQLRQARRVRPDQEVA